MALNTYEGMFILDSNRYASNPDGATEEVLTILTKNGGEILAHRPWQDGKLAYQIEGHRKGLYFLAYFKLDGRVLPEINRSLALTELVVRHLVLKVDPALVEPMLANISGEGVISNFTEGDSALNMR